MNDNSRSNYSTFGNITCIVIIYFSCFPNLAITSDAQILTRLDSQICNCIVENHKSFGADIKADLFNYQEHLIANGYLKDKTGKSFIAILNKIVRDNDNLIIIDSYDQYKSISVPKEYFSNCFIYKKNAILQENHPLKKYYFMFDNQPINDHQPSVLVNKLLSIIDERDFENEIFCMFVLYSLLMTSNSE